MNDSPNYSHTKTEQRTVATIFFFQIWMHK